MFDRIKFKNFKALRDAVLPLSQFTLIVGANGSGKSSGLSGVNGLRGSLAGHAAYIRSVGVPSHSRVEIIGHWEEPNNNYLVRMQWEPGQSGPHFESKLPNKAKNPNPPARALERSRFYSLDAVAIAHPVQLQPELELAHNGANLAGVLDRLRDGDQERFDFLNEELARWIPEFDRVLFETPGTGMRSIALRTREGRHPIPARELSQGTLIALALLTIAHLPEPPSIVCLEEPDHGLHPRLLRDVRDALYRLAYPDGARESRAPVQVIATTHNPYFLDLFRDHPEQIVIAEKVGLDARFSRLSDRADLDEILSDAPLSEVWYSGVLGGVPVGVCRWPISPSRPQTRQPLPSSQKPSCAHALNQ